MPLPLLASLILALSQASTTRTVPIPDDPLVTLSAEHPRILATASDFTLLKERIKTDPVSAQMAAAVLRRAEADLGKPLPRHILPDGKRLLGTSNELKKRMQTLGLAWQLTGDRKYPERAWKDLEAAGNFPDWNPPHFLDTAEMTLAFAMGLDWMHDAWSPEQRERISRWIIEHGLTPAIAAYGNPTSANGRQVRTLNNWAQVCNGGIGMGALAIANLHPKEAGEALRNALRCIQPSLARYAPDGGWDEGYSYQGYGLEYSTGLVSSLVCSLGTDYGLSRFPGFSSTPDFSLYLEGPCGTFFGFADCGQDMHRVTSFPWAGWISSRFHNDACAAAQRVKAAADPDALGLLWLPSATAVNGAKGSARVKNFEANPCCTLRTAWGDTKAGFVGFKGGDNRANHGHLDVGSFVYDSGGEHWAVDLGSDNYNLPGYFGHRRWDYYRLRAEGHNTLVVDPGNGPDQSPKAFCPITLCVDRGDSCAAVADLGNAYPTLASAKRGVLLSRDGSLRIQDELDARAAKSAVFWFMHTPSTITLAPDGRTATLVRGGKSLTARLVSPRDARFETMEASPLPPSPNPQGQKVNRGITKLTVRAEFKGAQMIVVDLVPDRLASALPHVTPLATW